MFVKRMIARVAIGTMVLAGSVAVAAPAGASEPASETTKCGFGHWPAEVQGKPGSLQAGAATGVYLWHDDNGWHLYATHPGHDRVVFKGRVVSSGHIYGVGRHVEGRDVVTVVGHDKSVDFRFANYGYLDGAHFRTSCARRIGVTGYINGVELTPDQVFIGADGHHPGSVPFEVARTH